MKRETAVLTLLLCCLGSQTYAGSVLNKKAMRSWDKHVAKALRETRAACEHATLKINMNWQAYERYVAEDKNKEAIIAVRDKVDWVFVYAGNRARTILRALGRLCRDDGYKSRIRKLQEIKMLPHPEFMSRSSSFKLENNNKTLQAMPSHRYDRTPDDYIVQIKQLW